MEIISLAENYLFYEQNSMRYLHLMLYSNVCMWFRFELFKQNFMYIRISRNIIKHILIPKVESKYRNRTKDFDVSNFVYIMNDCTIPIVTSWSSCYYCWWKYLYIMLDLDLLCCWITYSGSYAFLLRCSKRSSEKTSPKSLSTIPQVLQTRSKFEANVLIVSRYVVTTHRGDTFLLGRVLAFRITSHCFWRVVWRRCRVAR